MSAGAILAVAVVAVAAGTAAGGLLLGWLGAWRLNRAPARVRGAEEFTFSPFELDMDHEPVAFRTADGVDLSGWFLPRRGTRRCVIAMHGYRGEMSQVLGVSSRLWRSGFNVLLFDFRGRGRSGTAPISMGLWETADLAAALDWVEDRVPGARIGLFGFSMGAVVALLGGADRRVAAIVADSAFAAQRDLLEEVAVRDSARFLGGCIDGRRLLPAVEWWHRRWGKPPFDAVAPVEAVAALDGTPVLFIHGGRDRYVPRAHVERLVAAAGGEKEAWIVEDALHCGAYFVDRRAYVARVSEFLESALGEEARK